MDLGKQMFRTVNIKIWWEMQHLMGNVMIMRVNDTIWVSIKGSMSYPTNSIPSEIR